jgi:hypothetical protein
MKHGGIKHKAFPVIDARSPNAKTSTVQYCVRHGVD